MLEMESIGETVTIPTERFGELIRLEGRVETILRLCQINRCVSKEEILDLMTGWKSKK